MADFAQLTEVPRGEATPEGYHMLLTRYAFAADLAADKDVLEVAAGPGLGLGWLARKSRRVVGTDLTVPLVRAARETYGARVPVAACDAQRLPFADGSFDLVVLYEAIYYMPDAGAFVQEARRVLRPGGTLLMCTANRERPGFVKSPLSYRYHDGEELRALLDGHGLRDVRILGAFRADPPSLKSRAILRAIGVADALHLIPRSLEGRARFKRLLHGKLVRLPPEIGPGDREPEQLHPWTAETRKRWKVLYALGVRP